MSSYVAVTSGGVRWRVLPDLKLVFEFGAFADLAKVSQRGAVRRELRHTRLVEIPVVDLVFLMKVYKRGGWLRRFWTWFHGPRARRELENCLGAMRRGVQVVPLTAVGERGLESFVVTQKLDGWSTLEETLFGSEAAGRARRDMLFQFGVWLRQVHDSGVWQPDLEPADVLVKTWGDAVEFRLIDFQRMRLFRAVPESRRLAALAKLNRWPRLSKADRVRVLDGYVHKYPEEARAFRQVNEKLLRLQEQQADRATVRIAAACVQDNRNFGPFATERFMGYYRRHRADGDGAGIDIEEAVRIAENPRDDARYRVERAAQALWAWRQANVRVKEGGDVPVAVLVENGRDSGFVVYRRQERTTRIGLR